MNKIKFGTDGWRAIIGKHYTTDNVARVTIAVAKWLNIKKSNSKVVIGYDCRFGGPMFAEIVAKVLSHFDIKVFLSKSFVSTPMVSLGVVNKNADLGIVITASHNPPEYNGYKLKGNFGGPLSPEDVQEIEDMIPEINSIDYDKINLSKLLDKSQLIYVDLEEEYCSHTRNNFDISLINNSKINFAYDAMFGAGMNVVKKLLPNITFLHCSNNPGFQGISPEPIHRNLNEFSNLIKNSNINCGLATDGDADRLGLYNQNGNFIDSHHIILLLIHYLVKYKGMTGKVVTAFSCSVKVSKLCEYYNLKHEIVQIGFKHIAKKMLIDDVLLGGEESGGIATKGHIPERDGIWMGLTLFEFMAKSGKTLDDLINEVYAIVGKFAFERNDLNINEELKSSIIEKCQSDYYDKFGNYKVIKIEKLDGFKFYFDDNSWLMIRPSGTEPVLRTYAEASSIEIVLDILDSCKKTIL